MKTQLAALCFITLSGILSSQAQTDIITTPTSQTSEKEPYVSLRVFHVGVWIHGGDRSLLRYLDETYNQAAYDFALDKKTIQWTNGDAAIGGYNIEISTGFMTKKGFGLFSYSSILPLHSLEVTIKDLSTIGDTTWLTAYGVDMNTTAVGLGPAFALNRKSTVIVYATAGLAWYDAVVTMDAKIPGSTPGQLNYYEVGTYRADEFYSGFGKFTGRVGVILSGNFNLAVSYLPIGFSIEFGFADY